MLVYFFHYCFYSFFFFFFSSRRRHTRCSRDWSSDVCSSDLDETVQCDDIPEAAVPTATDNCDASPAVNLSQSSTKNADPENCGHYNYTITRTWTATDACGNSSQGTQVITVIDDTDPQLIGVPVDEIVQCDDIPDAAAPTATDNCDETPDVSLDETDTQHADPENCGHYNYTITRTWTATDACGNTSVGTQTITVIDDTDPVLLGVPVNETVQCDDIPDAAAPTASDNCDETPDVSLDETDTQHADPENCGHYSYTITRTWTATDACGNTSVGTQTITVIDDTDPVLLGVPVNEIVQCDDIPDAAVPTATDNCDETPDVSLDETDTQHADPENCGHYSYTITRTWTATDACGNTSVGTQTITVIDDTDPVLFGVPDDETVQCDAIPSAATPTATDNCDATPAVSLSQSNTLNPDLENCGHYNYTITRTWTATDACGNTSVGTQTITVIDDTDPVLMGVPVNETVQCDDIPDAATPTATDNCDETPDVSLDETDTQHADPENCGHYNYTITRTWTATDACGNSSQGTQVITVIDDTDPVLFGVPDDETVQCDAIPSAATPTATDNCDATPAVSLSQSNTLNPDLENCGHYNYTITRTWTATDACGNTSVGTQTITVIDDTDPVLMGVPVNETVQCDDIPDAATPTATDNCDETPDVSLDETDTQHADPENCGHYNYTITRTWTATDACGNSSQGTQVITVIDDTDPVLLGVPVDETVQCDAIPSAATPTATDNCDATPQVSLSQSNTQNPDLENCGHYSYMITRTWTATDACGNTSQGTQMISVIDNTPPTATCQNITVELDANGAATILPTEIDNGSTDNCSATLDYALDISSFDCDDVTQFTPILSADLIISQYIEGTANNRAIEIYNGTGSAVNLGTNEYQLRLFASGASTPTATLSLPAISLANGEAYVIAHSDASAGVLAVADLTNSTVMNFNGDDAIALTKNGVAATPVDIFGSIGTDPGTEWTGGSNSTLNRTLRRKSSVTQGVITNPSSTFPQLATEWDGYPVNDATGLGEHAFDEVVVEDLVVTLTVTDACGNSS